MERPIEKRQVLAVIPARGASKGIPRKNLVMLGDMPLIAYSIRAALECEGIDRVVVSTEDKEIAKIAREWGAEVPFLRPIDLAQDTSSVNDAINYTVFKMGGQYPDVIITLLPTQPFRSAELMSHLVQQSKANFGQVRTVTPVTIHANSHVVMGRSKTLQSLWRPFFAQGGLPYRVLHRFNGLFLAYIPSQSQTSWYIQETTDPTALIDIDSWDDLNLAREVIEMGLFDFGW